MEDINEIKSDVMVNWLYQQQMERLWTAGGHDEGVVLKKGRGAYTCCPSDIIDEPVGFFKAVQTLNVRVAMTVNTRVIKLFLHNNDKPYVPLGDGLRLQVLPDMSYLPRCQKHQFAAFIADRGILVVWDDQPRHLLDRAERIERELMAMIWQGESPFSENEKAPAKSENVSITEVDGESGADVEAVMEAPRSIVLIQPVLSACTMALTIVAIGAALAGNIAQLIGPIAQMNSNTKFYSGMGPKRLRRDNGPLPHMTIQCPVYKEGLTSVIAPTIMSVKAAISTYEMQGGTANIFINDDGMQLLSPEDAQARQDFYDEHNIGWVARPKHNPKPEDDSAPFIRRGKFKKASNMNYAMWVSNRVEEKLTAIFRPETWTQEDEAAAYRDAMSQVVEEDAGRTWADGNIRIGDYILLIDSDTRVPSDCFLDAVSEMEQSPQVAIIQFSSGVMNVTDNFFEKGITFFTNLVYTAIRYAVANGDVAPFVGHNAVLRWSAMQAIAYDCVDDDREKYWSEATVSEDFDMALRLQSTGYLVRLGAYTGQGFKEGVSLTVYDELARWEKYAYGCNELIFHPVRYWFTRGPITPLFRRFLTSGMPLPSKLTILAYIGTYYAIGSAWILTLANYFLTGWLNGHLDHYYIDSFKVYFAIIIVFSALGNVALAVLRYRIEEKSLFAAFIENFKWVPLLSLFLGGISLHVSQALLSHMFGIDMSWGATAKEVENTTFFKEIPKVIKSFKFTFIFCIVVSAAMIVCAQFAPPLWRITYFFSIWPLATIIFSHFMLPIMLNPNLMLFTW
ncbi:glycosyl transferase family group 2-domain-containing protein [Cryomyces antarcticus]